MLWSCVCFSAAVILVLVASWAVHLTCTGHSFPQTRPLHTHHTHIKRLSWFCGIVTALGETENGSIVYLTGGADWLDECGWERLVWKKEKDTA